MISRIKSKPCTIPTCNNPRFSGGLCLFHQKVRRKIPKSTKAYKRIPKVSRKRKVENVQYQQACREADRKYSFDGETYCFFCMRPTGMDKQHHHIAGRGKNLLKGLIPAHSECHLAPRGFHGLTPAQLATKPYIERYLDLYKETDEAKYKVFLGKLKAAGYEGNHA